MNFGKAFPDSLHWGRERHITRNPAEAGLPTRSWRLLVLVIVAILTFVVFEARLFRLSITEGAAYRLRSEDNRLHEELIPAPRGIIFDRHNVPITRNVPFYRKRSMPCPENEPCEVAISAGEARLVIARGEEQSLIFRIGREYLLKEAGAHLTGYIGEINDKEIEEKKRACPAQTCLYHPGDLIGRGGVEEMYEGELRGTDGKHLVEVDAQGERIRALGEIPAISGSNIAITIDAELQTAAGNLLASRSGAIVASIPQSGEILAIASSPSFDPNLFTTGDDRVLPILENPLRPLFDRAIAGTYPPGSTFKIVTATAALEEKKLTPDQTIEDTGVITIGPYKFHNWYFTGYGKTEGSVNVVRAITRSNDIFFYRVGERLGVEPLASWAKRFGFGKTTGIDLAGETPGLVPDTAWKKAAKGEDWFLGDTFHYAIGQGDLLATPLQVNVMTGIVASNGKWCKPHIRKQEASDCQAVGISAETLAVVKQGMVGACSQGGTAYPLFKFKVKSEKLKVDGVDFLQTYEATKSSQPVVEIPVACKTGTAEFGDPKGRTHAWLTAFAPAVNPQIAVTVLVEGGGEGSSVAAPIAKKILENWFSR